MTSLREAELKDALEHLEWVRSTDGYVWPRRSSEVQVVIDAARTLLSILDASEEVSWCEVHHSYFLEQEPDQYAMCIAMLHENAWDAFPEPESCHIVSVRLIPSSLLAGLDE